MNTTTIEITDGQKAALEERKVHDREPIRDVVGRLLDGDTSAQESEDIAAEVQQAIDSMAFNGQMSDETADRIIKRIDDLENSLPNKVAGELQR